MPKPQTRDRGSKEMFKKLKWVKTGDLVPHDAKFLGHTKSVKTDEVIDEIPILGRQYGTAEYWLFEFPVNTPTPTDEDLTRE